MSAIDDYFETQKKVYDYFGFEDSAWRVFPLDDQRGIHWMLTCRDRSIVWSEAPFTAESIPEGKHYSGTVYHQRHLARSIWRAKDHTMVLVDTQTDLNTFLMIFDNALECTDEALRELMREHW